MKRLKSHADTQSLRARFAADCLLPGRTGIAGRGASLDGGGIPRPACLDRDTIELLQAALAKGVVRLLARQGWQRERFLRGEQPVEGRLWQRWRPEELGMAFSVASLELLIWLTTRHAPDLPSRRAARKRPETTLGDRFIAFLAFRAVENTPVAEEMRRLPAVVDNSLCRLAFPQEFADGSHPSSDWSPWITGPGVPVFEALQQELGQRWVRIEENKMQSTRVENILNVGLCNGGYWRGCSMPWKGPAAAIWPASCSWPVRGFYAADCRPMPC